MRQRKHLNDAKIVVLQYQYSFRLYAALCLSRKLKLIMLTECWNVTLRYLNNAVT